MPAPSLDKIAAMTDEELRSLLGQDQELETFKEEITKMQALAPKARRPSSIM